MSARELQSALRRIVGTDEGYQPLESEPEVGPQPGGVGVGHPGSAGEASALLAFEEADYTEREYWPTITMSTGDGLFTWEEMPIRSILLVGGSRARFAEPV